MSNPMGMQDGGLADPASTSAAPEEPGAPVISKSPWQLALARLRKDRLTMVSVAFVVFFILIALTGPLVVKFGLIHPLYNDSELVNEFGLPVGKWGGITGNHLLGIEPGTGRDTLSRLWYGTTFSLLIALSATIIAMVLGVVLGIVSGAAGGWVDAIIGRLIDLTLAFPQTLMLLALASTGMIMVQRYLHTPAGNVTAAVYVVVVLGAFGWTGVARVVRGQVLSMRELEFVHASHMMGASKLRIYFREILPNLWAPVLVMFTLMMPLFVSAEAALAYLGVGINAPTPTLGNVLTDSVSYAETVPLFFFVPAITIAAIVVSFNLLGDGLRDALDPKSDR